MGLTAEVELTLTNVSLVTFFDRNREAFTEVAQASYEFAAGYVKDTGLPVRQDDVATALVGALVTNRPLREYLAGKKLRQKYWYRYFADLILDRVWKELTDEPSATA